MDLTKEDLAGIYYICTQFQIEKNDPMVAFLMEVVKTRREILSGISDKMKTSEELIQSLKSGASEIGNTLNEQRAIAAILNKQANYFGWIKKLIPVLLIAVFLLGAGASYFTLIKFNDGFLTLTKLKENGAVIEFKNTNGENQLVIKSKKIKTAQRSKELVVVGLDN